MSLYLPKAPLAGNGRRLAAIMFTDMVGYTALGQRNETLSLALVEEQRKVIRPILIRHDGREVKTIGDAFLVEFPNAVEAVRCAYDIQRAIREFNLSLESDKRIHLRVGLHTGEVVESQGDISGDAVNVASRIEPLAEDGGVCVTRQVYDLVKNKVDIPLLSMGIKPLKNVAESLEIYKMSMPWEKETMLSSAGLDKRRVAVLPFANMSPDPNDEYFADGLTEELIDRLSQLRELEVISRTSVMNYKKKEKNASQIGKELSAGSLVEGSVRKAGNRIRVTAQLINTNTEGHLWSSSYDRNLDDVFEVQSDIAQRVAESMRVRLMEDERTVVATVPTRNMSAHESYLRGLFLMNKGFNTGEYAYHTDAVTHFEDAIRLDPVFAPAYAALGNLYVALAGDVLPVGECFEKADRLISKASDLDDKSAATHLAKGNLALQYHMDYDMADVEFRKAIELSPSNSGAHNWYGSYLSLVGNYQRALDEVAVAIELDPLSMGPRTHKGFIYFLMRDYKKMKAQCQQVLELEPRSALFHLNLASAYYFEGFPDLATKEVDTALALGPDKYTRDFVAWVLAVLGRKEEARDFLRQIEEDKTTHEAPTNLAIAYVGLGESEKALSLLERDFEQSPVTFLFRFRYPSFDPIREEPRFASLVERLNLPRN